MNAIVKISGKQFKVAKDTKLFVNRIDAKEGSKVSFDDVLLIDNGSKVIVGNPIVKDASVEAKVVKHLKDDKVIVFKKKRRKGYRVKNGHRQSLTEIIIEKVTEKTAKAKPAKKSEESKAPKVKKAAPKAKKAAPKAKSKK
tara:strand:- start:256 stop:678 length:423 start_codon:yes stop_codon:yes gene_type:complete